MNKPLDRSGIQENQSESGIIIIDKPKGLTSHDVVARVRRWLKTKKVGHCGTLDPIARGVLVLCINQATKIAEQLLRQDKFYRFTVRLGIRTDTCDAMGKVIESYSGPPLERSRIEEILSRFTGRIRQKVPQYSAAKIGGRRLYDYARAGMKVETPLRDVTVYRLDIVSYRWPEAVLEAHTSKGTYIRQLADDIGKALGCGAHISALTRLASGPFHIDQAIPLAEFRELAREGKWHTKLISLSQALAHLPAIVVDDPEVLRWLRYGHLDPTWEVYYKKKVDCKHSVIRLITPDDRLIALWWPTAHRGQRHLRVFDLN